MKWLNDIISGYKEGKLDKKKRVNAAKSKLLTKEMSERIQIKEHKGKLFISVDNVPMIDAELLCMDVVDALNNIRENIIQYKCPTI